MMYLTGVIVFLIVLVLFIVILWLFKLRRNLGVLTNKVMYSDTDKLPGQTLYSKSLNLVGRPDYLVRQNNMIIPFEVKTGHTPQEPYMSHEMQLMAYCFLVEENYGVRPVGGYLKYPEKEFKIIYTDEAKESLAVVVREITESINSDIEFSCNHDQHN